MQKDNQSENIRKSFRGLLFLKHPPCMYDSTSRIRKTFSAYSLHVGLHHVSQFTTLPVSATRPIIIKRILLQCH